jgi:hypothetical protein
MSRILIAILLVTSIGETSLTELSAQTSGRRRAVRHPGAATTPSPLAAADSYSVSAGTTLTIAPPGVLANDTLNGASMASFGPQTGAEQSTLGTTLQTAQGGSLSLSAEGGFTYTPSSAFSGTDTFKYVIRNAGGTSSATVAIVVQPAQTAAVNDSYATAPEVALQVPAPGVLTNDTLGGGRITGFGARNGTEQTSLGGTSPTAQGGEISLSQDGGFTYTPPPTVDDGYGYARPFVGLDTFVYTIQLDSVVSKGSVAVTVQNASSDADYVVTSPGHYYAISGLSGENPVLTLTRGRTYVFEISAAPIHPFAILDAPEGSVSNNNITEGTLTFTVPLTATSYRYRCTTHGFGNVINTVP